MGNEESQMGMQTTGGVGPPMGYPQSDPRGNFSSGNTRQAMQNSALNFPPPNSSSTFRPASPFNVPRNPPPQRFPGLNSTGRFSTPAKPHPTGMSSTSPMGMVVDLSGLSEEEKRKIAEVMERAQAMQEMDSNPNGANFKSDPKNTPTGLSSTKNFETPTASLTLSKGSSGNFFSEQTVGRGQPVRSSLPVTEQSRLPSQTLSSLTPLSFQNNTGVNNETRTWPLPLSGVTNPATPQAQTTRAKPLLIEQQRSLSRSVSSEGQLSSPEDNRSHLALPEKWQETPIIPSTLPTTIAPTNSSFSRSPGTSAQVECCPLCRETELKIVTIHGKPQPLIGQLCARCGLIVCSKCGKVKKISDQQTPYWLCTRCVDVPWTPPTELDFGAKTDNLSSKQSTSRILHQDSYVAPLTHLVTADNTVQSDAVRSSPALFFDEPEYAPVETNEPTQYDHHCEKDDWETDYSENQPLPFDNSQGYSLTSTFHPISEEKYNSTPFNAPDTRNMAVNNIPARGLSPTQNQLAQPPLVTMEHEYYGSRDADTPTQFKPELEQPSPWHREDPSTQDLFPPQMLTFSSQDSLYEIQEEETSDYGSQIQAACSDIASLSNSTSGGDFGGMPRSWPATQNNQNNAGPHQWFEPANQNNVNEKSQENDNMRGIPMRRSNLVENFRTMPTPGTLPDTDQKHRSSGERVQSSNQHLPTNQNTQQYQSQKVEKGAVYVAQVDQSNIRITRAEASSVKPVGMPYNAGDVSSASSVSSVNTQVTYQRSVVHASSQLASPQIRQSNPVRQSPSAGSRDQIGEPSAISISNSVQLRVSDRSSEACPPQSASVAAYTNNPMSTQEMHVNTNRSLEERKTQYHDAGVTPRRLIHQGSRDDLLSGTGGSEIDEADSVTDGNVADFDTISQCSQLSTLSQATFPQSSSMTGLNRDGTQSMERRQKRRLPLLPKDDQAGCSITPEERERQKKELKRRLSGNLLRITQDEPSVDGVARPVVARQTAVPVQDWPNELTAGAKVITSKVAKRKKHKHLPQIPHDQDAPKVQQLKQQLRMLAARKAGTGFEDEKSFGSLPNNPLNRFKSVSGDEASSSTEYLTEPSTLFRPRSCVNGARNHYASDPALFRSILDQYHRVAQQEKRDQEIVAASRQNGEEPPQFQFGGSRSLNLQSHSDPEIQDIVARLQQFNRDLADTKELFRSTSSSLERRNVPRWKSDAELANRRWRRDATDWDRRPQPHYPHDPYLPQEVHGSFPLANQTPNFFHQRPIHPDQQPREWQDGFERMNNGFHDRFHEGFGYDEEQFRRSEYERMTMGKPQFYGDAILPQEMLFDRHYREMGIRENQAFYDLNSNMPYPQPWMNDTSLTNSQIRLDDPAYLLPLPYLQETQYPGFNPMTDIDNEDLSLYEPFDDPNFLPMGAGMGFRQTSQPMMNNGPNQILSTGQIGGQGHRSGPVLTNTLDAPLMDSRVSYSEEAGKVVDLGGNESWEEEKENISDTGSDGLNSAEKLTRSVSQKKQKKEDQRPKYNFATKRILLTRDPKDRSVSGNGLGVRIAGGKLIPNTNILGAFISKIWDNGIMATLDEVKEGDQVLEWNGIPLTNKSYEEVQEILDAGNGEVEMLLRCDFNVRNLEAELDLSRDRQASMAHAERARLRDMDSGDRSPLPSRSLFSGRKQDQQKNDDTDEIVYRPSNQLAPPSPGGMARKKSTSSGHTPVTGDIQLRMTYERCTLTLQVIKARNLKPADKSGFSDPYCKLNLVPGRASEYKYRTRHIMQTLNPEWKETFTFQSIDPNEIHHKQIEITVWDWDRLSADDFLGEVIVDLADPVHLDGTKRWYVLGERRPGATDEP